jgi:hypothetical protein
LTIRNLRISCGIALKLGLQTDENAVNVFPEGFTENGYGAGLVPTPFLLLHFLTVGMCLRGFVGMHSRLALVTGGGVSVMSGLLMLAGLMLLGSLVVMLGGFTAMH